MKIIKNIIENLYIKYLINGKMFLWFIVGYVLTFLILFLVLK